MTCAAAAQGLLATMLGSLIVAPAALRAAETPAQDAAQASAAAPANSPDCPARPNEKSIVVEKATEASADSSVAIAEEQSDDDRLEPIANVSDHEPELADPPADATAPPEPTLADAPADAKPGYAPATPGAEDRPATDDICVDDEDYIPHRPAQAVAPTVFEPANFNGIVPGEATRAQVLLKWGEPAAKTPGGATLTYELKDFPSIVVTFDGELVKAVRVQLFEPVGAAELIDRLGLAGVRPAVVVDDAGATTSMVFPERGVTFNQRSSLAAATATDGDAPIDGEAAADGETALETPDDDAVYEIVIGKIDAASFALRAENSASCSYSHQIADLETSLQFDPTVAAVRAKLAMLKLAAGQAVAAEKLAAAAVELEPRNDEIRLTWAKCLKYRARYDDAVRETRQVIESDHASQLVRARALEQLGLLAGLGSTDVQTRSVPLHNKAIELADKLVGGDDPAVSAAANQLLVEAHLAVAERIAAGNWKDKDQAVADWISRASGLAEEMITSGQADVSLRLQVAVSALSAGARLEPPIDPALWIAEAEETVRTLETNVIDPVARDEIDWQLGLAYYYATEIQHRRGHAAEALKYGALAESTLAPLAEARAEVPDTNYVLGRLYFQIGAVHAVHGQDHDMACEWYDRAADILLRPVPVTDFASPKQHGDALVSMGVSYWQTGQKDRAYELTKAGAELVEQGVAENLLAADALEVPRHNLSAMNRALGKPEGKRVDDSPHEEKVQVAEAQPVSSKSSKQSERSTTSKPQSRVANRRGGDGVVRRVTWVAVRRYNSASRSVLLRRPALSPPVIDRGLNDLCPRDSCRCAALPASAVRGYAMSDFQPADYGPVLAPLVSGDRCRALDAGSADEPLRRALQLATVDAAFAQSPVADREMAACTIAGVWLVHDFLDESHAISQNVETPTGAFWHGVMHRREGDYSNSKYWFRRVGAHETLAALDEHVAPLAAAAATVEWARRLLVGGRYDPFAMVDACQNAVRTVGAEADFYRRVQQVEWELLFDYSYRRAVGS